MTLKIKKPTVQQNSGTKASSPLVAKHQPQQSKQAPPLKA